MSLCDELVTFRQAAVGFADADLVSERGALGFALEQLMRVTDADAGVVAVPDRARELRLVAERRLGGGGPVSQTLLRQVLAAETSEAIVAELPDTASAIEAIITSILCVPVRRQGRVLAAIYLDRRGVDRSPFDEGSRELATSFAAGVAISLDLMQQIRDGERERNDAVELAREARAVAEHLQDWWRLGKIVTRHPGLARSLKLAERVASSDVNMLITGETGTGKEFLARCVHEASTRRNGPFVVVNCAALPESLVESELFGIDRQVATGVGPRRGLFQAASAGTLFLDEIGDIPLSMQPKLLHAVESKCVRRVGSTEEVQVDARIIAATNQDLGTRVAEGRFRDDLYYRLRIVSITIPPLRERRQDIAELARRLLEAQGARTGRRLCFASDAILLLERHEWPGNVRELRNAVELLVLAAEGDVITARDVEASVALSLRAPSHPDDLGSARRFRDQIDEAARRILTSALREGGSISGAARILGIARQTVSKKCHRLGLVTDEG